MSASVERRRREQLDRLVALATRARTRAAAALAEARERLAEAERVRDEQLALVEGLRASLRELARARAGRPVTVESLQLETRHRRWLTYDLEKESFYVHAMRRDADRAREAVRARALEWRRANARIDALGELGTGLGREAAKREARRADARADERSAGAGPVAGGRATGHAVRVARAGTA